MGLFEMIDLNKVVARQLGFGSNLINEPAKATFGDTASALLGEYEPLISNLTQSLDQDLVKVDPDFDAAQAVFDLDERYHEYSSTSFKHK